MKTVNYNWVFNLLICSWKVSPDFICEIEMFLIINGLTLMMVISFPCRLSNQLVIPFWPMGHERSLLGKVFCFVLFSIMKKRCKWSNIDLLIGHCSVNLWWAILWVGKIKTKDLANILRMAVGKIQRAMFFKNMLNHWI